MSSVTGNPWVLRLIILAIIALPVGGTLFYFQSKGIPVLRLFQPGAPSGPNSGQGGIGGSDSPGAPGEPGGPGSPRGGGGPGAELPLGPDGLPLDGGAAVEGPGGFVFGGRRGEPTPTGRLVIPAIPGVSVEINVDGVDVGRAPKTYEIIGIGQHNVTLTYSNGRIVTQSVVVRQDDTAIIKP